MCSLGALKKESREYILPKDAQKGEEYICMDCEQKVIFRNGAIRRAHFAHYSITNTCSYYEHPNESQIHKDAKYKLATWLNKKRELKFLGTCYICRKMGCECKDAIRCHDKNSKLVYKISYEDNDEVIVEYREPHGLYIADIAVINNGIVKYIFEIKHTHKTITDVRPEPWFEIDTAQFYENIDNEDNKTILECIRFTSKRICDICNEQKEEENRRKELLQKQAEEAKKIAQENERIMKIRREVGPEILKNIRQNTNKCSRCKSYERCRKCSDKIFKLYNEQIQKLITTPESNPPSEPPPSQPSSNREVITQASGTA